MNNHQTRMPDGKKLLRARSQRKGSAVVEFSILVMLLFTIVLGTIEICRGIFVKEILSNAVRIGCRSACLGEGTNASVIGAVKNILEMDSLNPNDATISILVNDKEGEVSQAKRWDKISVSVSIPFSKIYWTAGVFTPNGGSVSETVVMMRQS